MKIKYGGNQTLDQKVVILLWTKIILPMRKFITFVLINSPIGNFIHLNGGILYGYPKKTLGRNACICHHMDYL